MLDQLIPIPRLLQTDDIHLAADPGRVWELVRHGTLVRSPLIRSLFALRTLPEWLSGKSAELRLTVDDLRSSPDAPGFQLLAEDPGRELAVGAIGKVWRPEIPFVHSDDAESFLAFAEPGYVKVAWAIRVLPEGERDSRVEFELRVDATDRASWQKFERYFALIGPVSHFIRRALLDSLARELGTPEQAERTRVLAGDDLLDAAAQVTDGITIAATPQQIWPWLVQMGCRRAGFYSIDALDNAGQRSAREIHPELQRLAVGQIIPATPDGDDGFEVLELDAPHRLVLGGLYDTEQRRQLSFAAPRPPQFWQVTWAFVLEPLDARSTRLHVRARAAFSAEQRLHAAVIRPVHHFMQRAMLRHLKSRAEGSTKAELRDVLEGVSGAARMMAAFFTPFRRAARNHWGLSEQEAGRAYPGDQLVPEPGFHWTHAVQIAAPADSVWPWIAQIGAGRAGFYSYEWLENLVGCKIRNAETVHPEWALCVGQPLLLHPAPEAPRLVITAVDRGHHFVAHGAPDEGARSRGEPWAAASWLFLVEPLAERRCRLISRYRAAYSSDWLSRVSFGPALLEPVGFAMDRRMLLGVKERAEHAVAASAA
jgi:hypothetical protein